MPINHTIVKLQAVAAHIKVCVDVAAHPLGAAVHATLLRVDVAVGDFIKLLGFADSVALTDAQVIAFEKAVSEVLALVEQVALELSKPLHDQAHITETFERSIDKPLSEAKQAVDTLAKTFGKPIAPEALSVADTTTIEAEKAFTDQVYQLEGPATGQTYVDPTYFAQDYAWDGGPIKHVGKVLAEVAATTDDQTMVFTKSMVDHGYASEAVAKTFTRPGVTDTASASDSAAIRPIKGLADLVAHAEILAYAVEKNTTDAATSSEAHTRLTDKVLAEFPLSAADISTFSLAKVAVDGVGASDALTLAVARVATDTATGSDAASKTTGKALTDTSATSDSGHLRMTNYADITYFAQDFVGITLNF